MRTVEKHSLPCQPGAAPPGQTAQMEASESEQSAATPRGFGALSSVCSIRIVLSSNRCVAPSRTTSSRFLFMSTRSTALAKGSSKTGDELDVFHSRSRRAPSARSPCPTSAISDDVKSMHAEEMPPSTLCCSTCAKGLHATMRQPARVPTAMCECT